MKIWKLKVDFGNYKSFQITNKNNEFLENFNKEIVSGKPQNGKWDNMEIEPIEGRVNGDLVKVWNAFNTLVFSQKAKESMESLLGEQVEYIPVKYQDMTLYMLNILSIIDAVDYEKATFRKQDTGLVLGLKKYSFIQSKIKGLNIFMILLNGRIYSTEIYVTSEVKERVEENKLLGFKFEEVWDSEEKN